MAWSEVSIEPRDARTLATAIAWLRPCAAVGQTLAIIVAVHRLHVTLPLAPLLAGIIVLGGTTPFMFWRLKKPWRVSELEVTAHITFDLLLLGWALYFTGGPSNPFTTLLLVPVALAATALSWRYSVFTVALAGALYIALMFHYVPLSDLSLHSEAGFRLHLTGMAVNFLVAALLLVTFIGRLTVSLRAQRAATQRLRERILRDESILAIATQAAEAAHELNTPLSTLRTLLPELARGREPDVALGDDVRLMVSEVERCRDILRRMVDYGRGQLVGDSQRITLGTYVHVNVERFKLLCPDADVAVRIPTALLDCPIVVPPGLANALLNLLHNAFDASAQNNSRAVTFGVAVHAQSVEFLIRDYGNGLPRECLDDMPQKSDKPNGLGMGLALARATVERLRGDLQAEATADGTCIRVRVPIASAVRS